MRPDRGLRPVPHHEGQGHARAWLRMSRQAKRVVRSIIITIGVGASIAMTACTIGETRYETVRLPAKTKSEGLKKCPSPLANLDLTKLKVCGEGKGKAHCYDKGKLPVPESFFTPCEGKEVCV